MTSSVTMAFDLLNGLPSMRSNVVFLNVVRKIKKVEQGDPAYQAHLLGLDKLGLLEEMMKFQEERTKLGALSVSMMIQGQLLFKALENAAETEELRQLARSYRRHLKYELENYFKELSAAAEN